MENSEKQGTWATLGAVAMVVAGVLAMCLPLATSTSLIILLSWLLIFAGVGNLIVAVRARPSRNIIWELILSAASIFFGLYLRFHPTMGMSALVFVLSLYFLIAAISEFILYFNLRSQPRSEWILGHAVLNIVLFALIWMNWPANSAWLIGMFVGVDLVVGGLSRILSGAPLYHSRAAST